jgi:hypothetical protein
MMLHSRFIPESITENGTVVQIAIPIRVIIRNTPALPVMNIVISLTLTANIRVFRDTLTIALPALDVILLVPDKELLIILQPAFL